MSTLTKTAIKERPILFSTEMVNAILSGQKTQTRRVLKGTALEWLEYTGFSPAFVASDGNSLCPYGKVGDVLWVRESFNRYEPDGYGFNYKADFQDWENYKWKPSIHMPREACRLRLEITNIRVERLLDISHHDAIAEGVEIVTDSDYGRDAYKYYVGERTVCKSSVNSFRSLWESKYGEENLLSNPWVWVIEFKMLEGGAAQ